MSTWFVMGLNGGDMAPLNWAAAAPRGPGPLKRAAATAAAFSAGGCWPLRTARGGGEAPRLDGGEDGRAGGSAAADKESSVVVAQLDPALSLLAGSSGASVAANDGGAALDRGIRAGTLLPRTGESCDFNRFTTSSSAEDGEVDAAEDGAATRADSTSRPVVGDGAATPNTGGLTTRDARRGEEEAEPRAASPSLLSVQIGAGIAAAPPARREGDRLAGLRAV